MAEKLEVQAEEIAQSEPSTILHRVRHEAHPRLVPSPLSRHTICVNRSEKPPYPHWVRTKNGLTHPRLECTGPAQCDLKTQVGDLFHKKIKEQGSLDTRFIYNCLENTKEIAACLNLQDNLAIKRKGPAFFRELYAGKILLFFGTVVQHNKRDQLYVSCLFEEHGNLKDDFYPLESKCDEKHLVLYFK